MNACCSEVNSRSASASRLGGEDVDAEHDVGTGELLGGPESAAIDGRAPASIIAGAKCEANANGSPSAAASWAPNRLEPRIQTGTSSPAPGTACTAWPGSAGRK